VLHGNTEAMQLMARFAVIRGLLTRNQRQQVGDMDLLIASTAMEHGLSLLTLNVRDYRIIPGLTIFQR